MSIKKLCLIGMLSYSTLFANQTQAFSTTTMPILMDKDTHPKKLFSGTYEEYGKQFSVIYGNENLKTIGIMTGGASVLLMGNYLLKSGGSVKSFKSDGGIVGLAIVLAVGAVSAAVAVATEDYEYEYVSILTNSKGEKTILETHIVANDKLSQDELDKYGFDSQMEYINKKTNKDVGGKK